MITFPFRAERQRRAATRPLGLGAVGWLWPSDVDDDGEEVDDNDGMVLMMAMVMMIMIKHISRKGGPDVYSSAEMNALQEKLLF